MESLLRADTAGALAGARLLIVEDDFLLLMDLEEVLLDAGADVQACRTIADALRLSEKEGISAAILDVRIGPDSIAPVARTLAARDIPFVFYTGQLGNDPMMAEWPNSRTISKPALPQVIVKAVAEVLRSNGEDLADSCSTTVRC
jgi:DNA-binding response OmpR family regulator